MSKLKVCNTKIKTNLIITHWCFPDFYIFWLFSLKLTKDSLASSVSAFLTAFPYSLCTLVAATQTSIFDPQIIRDDTGSSIIQRGGGSGSGNGMAAKDWEVDASHKNVSAVHLCQWHR